VDGDESRGVTEFRPCQVARVAPVDEAQERQHEAGAKLDSDKIDLSLLLLFARALRELSRVGDYGQEKYSRGGFLEVPNGEQRYTAAMLRHLFEEAQGKVYDDDPYLATTRFAGTIRHDVQVLWNAAARLELKLREEEKNHG